MPAAIEQTESLAERVRRGERAAIANALNLVDDARPHARQSAQALLDELLPDYRDSTAHLIGITGPPGVGKSSLSAALIDVWRRRGYRVGVLAVDPSSPLSGGALLGDRLRMKLEAADTGVFVRSLSNRGQFGGLSNEVWPMSLLLMCCFDVVLVETVGVGQREVDVASSTDTTCFVAQPGSGDSIQFLKAGILEVPDVLVVNKQDMGSVAARTLAELSGTVQLEYTEADWQVPLLATSASQRTGIDELADTLSAHFLALKQHDQIRPRRMRAQAHWLIRRVEEDYGRRGLKVLGGREVLQSELMQQLGNPLALYRQLLLRLKVAQEQQP